MIVAFTYRSAVPAPSWWMNHCHLEASITRKTHAAKQKGWTKFEDFGIIRFWVIVQTDWQTRRQTRMNALLLRLSSAWVTICIETTARRLPVDFLGHRFRCDPQDDGRAHLQHSNSHTQCKQQQQQHFSTPIARHLHALFSAGTLWQSNPNLTFDLSTQNRTTCRIFHGHSQHQVWIFWDHSFWGMLRV